MERKNKIERFLVEKYNIALKQDSAYNYSLLTNIVANVESAICVARSTNIDLVEKLATIENEVWELNNSRAELNVENDRLRKLVVELYNKGKDKVQVLENKVAMLEERNAVDRKKMTAQYNKQVRELQEAASEKDKQRQRELENRIEKMDSIEDIFALLKIIADRQVIHSEETSEFIERLDSAKKSIVVNEKMRAGEFKRDTSERDGKLLDFYYSNNCKLTSNSEQLREMFGLTYQGCKNVLVSLGAWKGR